MPSRAGRARSAGDVLAALRAAGRLGNTVVIHIGTNGEVSDETFAAIMANLPPEEVKTVLFLTIRADRPWVEGNNARIIALHASTRTSASGIGMDLLRRSPASPATGSTSATKRPSRPTRI